MEEKTRRFRIDEINFHGLIALLLKNLWVIAALCISAILCYTSVQWLTYEPSYTSSATFMVSATDSTNPYNSLTTTQSMATVFVEVFQGKPMRDRIQEQMPNGEFDGTIQTQTIPETNLLIVSITSSEPDTSFRALNLLVENYRFISDNVFSNAQLEVIKDPVIPTAPSNPLNVKSKYVIVFMVAAVLSVSAVVAIYVLHDTVKTPKAAQRKLNARLLRTINHEEKNKTLRAKLRRRNTAPLITNSLIRKDFIEDNLSLCSSLEYYVRKRGQKVIMVTSVGENEGKSTIAANMALALAQKNRRVALLDCDFRKPSLHKIFELPIEKDKTITSYLLNDRSEPLSHFVESKKYDILLGLSHNSGKSITKLLNNGKLPEMLQYLRTQVDYVILDTPPMLAAADAESIAEMADTSVLVARADYMHTGAINEGIERLQKSGPDVCGVVLNNYRTSIW